MYKQASCKGNRYKGKVQALKKKVQDLQGEIRGFKDQIELRLQRIMNLQNQVKRMERDKSAVWTKNFHEQRDLRLENKLLQDEIYRL